MPQLVAAGGGQVLQHDVAPILGEGAHQLEHVVDLEPAEDLGEPFVGDRFDDLGQDLRRELAEHPRGAAVLEQEVDHDPDLVRRQVLQDRPDVRRVDALEELFGAEMGPRLQEPAQDAGRDDRLGHGGRSSWWRAQALPQFPAAFYPETLFSEILRSRLPVSCRSVRGVRRVFSLARVAARWRQGIGWVGHGCGAWRSRESRSGSRSRTPVNGNGPRPPFATSPVPRASPRSTSGCASPSCRRSTSTASAIRSAGRPSRSPAAATIG
jgi:hypothetical protein